MWNPETLRELTTLRHFDQFHFAVPGSVQDHHFAFGIAEYEEVSILEVSFFDGLLQGHGTHGDGFIGSDDMHFGNLGHSRISVNHDGHSGFFRDSDDGLQFLLRRGTVAVPLLHFFTLAGGALLRHPLCLIFDRLLFQVVDGLVHRNGHVLGLSQADQWTIAGADGDFGFVAVFFDGEDNIGIKSVAQNFADFAKAGFYFFADDGSDYVVSSRVFHVHEGPRPSLDYRLNRAPH